MATTPDYPVLGPPRISAAGFTEILRAGGSPATAEAAPAYQAAMAAGVDPAVLLAIFRKESTFGRFGKAASTRSWGNIRNSDGSFRAYASWTVGAADTARLIAIYGRNQIRPGRQTNTVQTLPYVWAPSSDGNAPDAYGDQLASWITDWQRRYPATGSGPGVASSSSVQTVASSSVITFAEVFRRALRVSDDHVVVAADVEAVARYYETALRANPDYTQEGIPDFMRGFRALLTNSIGRRVGELTMKVGDPTAPKPSVETLIDDTSRAIAGLPSALGEILKRGGQAVILAGLVILGLYLLARG